MKKGFFKKDDVIEVSGRIYGLVTFADDMTADIQKIVITSTGNYLTDTKQVFRNSVDQYENAYWIKKLKRQNVPLEYLTIKSMAEL